MRSDRHVVPAQVLAIDLSSSHDEKHRSPDVIRERHVLRLGISVALGSPNPWSAEVEATAELTVPSTAARSGERRSAAQCHQSAHRPALGDGGAGRGPEDRLHGGMDCEGWASGPAIKRGSGRFRPEAVTRSRGTIRVKFRVWNMLLFRKRPFLKPVVFLSPNWFDSQRARGDGHARFIRCTSGSRGALGAPFAQC